MDYEAIFYKLIETAKQHSKDAFLRFVSGVYGVDEFAFEHIFEIPIIGRFDADELVTSPLSTKTEDELYEIVNEAINSDKDWTDTTVANYVNFDEIEDLSKIEKTEWYSKIGCNAAIVYNSSLFLDRLKKASKEMNEKELFDKFEKILSKAITHERVHVNNAYYDINLKKQTAESLNGAEANIRYDIEDSIEHAYYEDFWTDNSEILIHIITLMISNYKIGDSLNNCLKKVIQLRNGKTIYPKIEDRLILGTYILFTDELTEWMLFGAYDLIRENKLQKKFLEIFGTDLPLSFNDLKKKFEYYLSTMQDGALSNTQIAMLNTLGFSTIQKTTNKDDTSR